MRLIMGVSGPMTRAMNRWIKPRSQHFRSRF